MGSKERFNNKVPNTTGKGTVQLKKEKKPICNAGEIVEFL